ncbi:MAG: ParB/RepB/Spo0J family partition protein [Eubacterium sp.]|nr:ParB/RepB/Spo0J family partition protein [Eubacterium sp.]
MKTNAPRRKIFDDAIDVLTGTEEAVEAKGGVQEIPIKEIEPFHDHPFRLYEGERLDDMVDSIKTHGVLTPVIVRKVGKGYEMLAGHNRVNAARIADLETVPAIVKEDLSDEDAYVYVIETNLMQRSFTDFLPSEKAVILAARYENIKSQGKRNDILREIAVLQGETSGLIDQKSDEGDDLTSGLLDQKLDGRGNVAEEYGLSSKTVARLLRLNSLIPVFRALVDKGTLPLYAAVEISFLTEEAQGWIYDAAEKYKIRINMKSAKLFRDVGDDLTVARVDEIAKGLAAGAGKSPSNAYQNVRLPKIIYKKYFKDMNDDKVQAILQIALEQYFKTQTT